MRKGLSISFAALACFSLLSASPPAAQSASSAAAQSATNSTLSDPASRHHQLQQQIMSEMMQKMARMTEQLSHRKPSPEESTKMGEEMGRMAKVMRFMSGLEARPAHNDQQMQRQMDEMRAQMKALTGGSLPEAK